MVQFNANGLYEFYNLMKQITTAVVNFGKDQAIHLIKLVIAKFLAFKKWLKQKFDEYFVKGDLSKDELKTQITVL